MGQNNNNLDWDNEQEKIFKKEIKNFFDFRINHYLEKSNNPLLVGDELANILKSGDSEVVKIITPRAVKKWASPQTISKWLEIIKNPVMLSELRTIGKSIANTMRPLAGNNFSLWVASILNSYFKQQKLPLEALTSGPIKIKIGKSLVIQTKENQGILDYRPDIDIVLVRTDKENYPVAIISAKTTLAERVMQTITWSRFLKNVPEYTKMKMFLVTAWDTFDSGTNIERVQELDGIYVCNKNVKESRKIKLFSKIGTDLKEFCS